MLSDFRKTTAVFIITVSGVALPGLKSQLDNFLVLLFVLLFMMETFKHTKVDGRGLRTPMYSPPDPTISAVCHPPQLTPMCAKF